MAIPCPQCRHKTNFTLPEAKAGPVIVLYGDEAFREAQSRAVYVVALVGSDQRIELSVLNEWRALKQSIAPTREPNTWRIHMKELWKTSGGIRHPVFGTMSLPQRIAAVAEIGKTYVRLQQSVFTFVSFREAPRLGRNLRQQALLSSIAHILDTFCPRGSVPRITLESDKIIGGAAGMSYGTGHALAEFQRTLLYAILSRGLPIEDIAVARAETSAWFEIADFSAYVIARAIYRSWTQESPDIDPDFLGNVWWIGNRPDGNLMSRRCKGIPWADLAGSPEPNSDPK